MNDGYIQCTVIATWRLGLWAPLVTSNCMNTSSSKLTVHVLTCTSKTGAFRLPDFSVDSDSAGLSMEFSFGDSGTRVTLSLRKGESFASDRELSSTVSSGASSVLGSEFSVPG